jgi:transposase-like protein
VAKTTAGAIQPIRERVREVIELILEEEVDTALGAGRSQRVAERCGYRHGRKPRRLTLRTGAVQLEVPRGRLVTPDGGEQEWHSQLVPRYRRSSAEVEQSVLGVYLSGSNTRRIRGALEPLLSGAALSKSAVSRLVLRLEESYRLWQRRDLAEEKILYLYLDAIYPKVRSAGRVVFAASPLQHGIPSKGWVCFKVPGIKPTFIENDELHLTLVDSFGGKHSLERCGPWVYKGDAINPENALLT